MAYKVLGGNWGEGHQPGDVINLDDRAARVRLALGEIEEVIEPKKATVVVAEPEAEEPKKTESKSQARRKQLSKKK